MAATTNIWFFWLLATGYWLLGTGYWVDLRLFLHWLFLGSKASFHRGTDAGQHVLGGLRHWAAGIEFEILLEGLGGAVGCDHLIVFQRRLANQVDTLPVIGHCLGGVGGNDLVEGRNGVVHFANVSEDSALVEIVSCGVRRIERSGLVVVGDRVVSLVGFGVRFRQVVVISGHFEIVVGILLRLFGNLAQVDRLLVVGGGHLVALLFLVRIGLLGGGQTVSIGQLEPDEIVRRVHLVGVIQGRDRLVEVAGSHLSVGLGNFFVERLDGVLLLGGLGLLVGCGLGLLRRHALALGCGDLLFLQIDILVRFLQADRDITDCPELLAILGELEVVLAWDDAEREVLALVV